MNTDYLCGLSFWRPKWLQKCANIRWFMAVYGLLGTVQGISSAYLVVTLTTIEKRFHMPSQTTGIVLSGNEISQVFLSLILSYVGGQKNRPLWIAWGMFFCGVSCLVLATPHFIYGMGDEAYQLTKEYYADTGGDWSALISNSSSPTKSTSSLCRLTGINNQKCNDLVTFLPLALIFMSQFILGVGNTLYYSLGQTFVDDNTTKRNTPLLFAFAMAMRMIGPTLGFMLGPRALSLFIDPSKTPLITKNDPRWLGAWWLGWLIIGIVMFVFSGLLALFPRNLTSTQNQSTIKSPPTDVPQTAEKFSFDSSELVEKQIGETPAVAAENSISFKNFCSTMKRVLKNKIIIFNNISGIFYILGASGYLIYLGRYVEVQFHKTSQNATSLPGQFTMLGTVLGLITSGWVLSRLRPAPSKVLFWNVIIGVCYALVQFSYLFLYCKGGDSAVIKQWSDLTTTCNSDCNCGTVSYNPVCNQDTNELYFSPCHAGCKSWDPNNNTYTNCSCTSHDHAKSKMLSKVYNLAKHPTVLTGGLCTKKSCAPDLYAFVILAMLIAWLNSTGRIGNILVNYRAVADPDKAFTQGLTLMMLSMFAFIPGPIIFGRVIDNACVVSKYSCGKRGDCQLYDQDSFRYYMNTLAMVFTIIGTIFDGLVWYYGKNLDLYGDNDQNEDQTNTTKNEESAKPLIN